MRISIIGTGYVGLVTGVCLAEHGHQVVCVDVDERKVRAINDGIPPIHERGLPELLRRHAGSRLVATSQLSGAVRDSDITLIAVGTPFDGQTIDLAFVKAVAEDIGAVLREKPSYHVVVVKSTVVPGTTDSVVLPILEATSGKRAGIDFGVGMNPEFLTEGQAIDDFMSPDRIVIGGIDQRSVEAQAGLYASFANVPVVRTNTRTAEMIKYASNAMLATAISFANEIGNLCATIGDIDSTEVMWAVHKSTYLSPMLANGDRVLAPIAAFLEAGCGFGGSCLPKDVKALVAHGHAHGERMPLLGAVIDVNEQQPARTLELLDRHFPSLAGLRVAVLGIAFKPDTDDIRQTPALPIVRGLLARRAQVSVYDPVAGAAAAQLFGDAVESRPSLRSAVGDVEAIVIVTRWAEFADIPRLLQSLEHQPVVIDGRRMLDRESVSQYEGIGYRRRGPAAGSVPETKAMMPAAV